MIETLPSLETLSPEIKNALHKLYYDECAYLGRDGLWRLARTRFPDLKITRRATQAWLKSQEIYQKTVRPRKKREDSSFINIRSPTVFSLDLKGPMPKARGGYQYILICVRLSDRFLFTKPLHSTGAAETANAFGAIMEENELEVHAVRSDNGGSFLADFSEFCRSLGISQIFSVPGRPYQNYAERIISNIVRILDKLSVQESPTAWFSRLQQITTVLNNAYNRSLKCTPTEATSLPQEIINKRLDNFGKVRARQRKTAFRIGDLVRLRKTGKQGFKPHSRPWSDEIYEIVKVNPSKIGLVTYKLASETGDLVRGVYNVTDLQKVGEKPKYLVRGISACTGEEMDTERELLQTIAEEPGATIHLEENDGLSEGEYIVEKIVEERQTRRGVRFKVRWRGFSETDDSWLSEHDLRNARGVLNNWKKNRRR